MGVVLFFFFDKLGINLGLAAYSFYCVIPVLRTADSTESRCYETTDSRTLRAAESGIQAV